MSVSNKLLIAALSVALFLTLSAANLVTGMDRTILNQEFVEGSLEEEEAYTTIGETLSKKIEEEGEESSPFSGLPVKDIAANYTERQADKNIERLYSYIEGGRDSLVLKMETEPLIDRLKEGIEKKAEEKAGQKLDPERESRLKEKLGGETDNIKIVEVSKGDTGSAVKTFRQVASSAGIFASILFLASAVLAGLIFWASSSRSSALIGIGTEVSLVGGAGIMTVLALENIAIPQIRSEFASASEQIADVVLGMFSQITGEYMAQSIAILVIGLCVLSSGLAVRWQILPVSDRKAG